MKRQIYILLLLASLVLAGCTPTSEGIAKRGSEPDGVTGMSSQDLAYQSASIPRLDPSTRQIIRSYGPTIRKYSMKYGFDWRLTLAVMKAESNFLDSAESDRGASGLMQIMPSTQEEMAKVLDIQDMTQPQSNIRAGIFYLSRLYKMFDEANENDRIRLTLAAYNAGPGRVFDAQDMAEYLHDNPERWSAVRDAMPMLSSRYSTLHKNVWPERRTRATVFDNYRETIAHVEKIMNYYDRYRLVLN